MFVGCLMINHHRGFSPWLSGTKTENIFGLYIPIKIPLKSSIPLESHEQPIDIAPGTEWITYIYIYIWRFPEMKVKSSVLKGVSLINQPAIGVALRKRPYRTIVYHSCRGPMGSHGLRNESKWPASLMISRCFGRRLQVFGDVSQHLTLIAALSTQRRPLSLF